MLRTDIIDGNLKLILGMIWTLILRFTIADIRFVVLLQCSSKLSKLAKTPLLKVKKVFQPKKVFSCGVNAKRNHTRKLMCKISPIAGQTG
jgi:Ca2+-binding actin-bundling protein fimbrin/plastin (EF-Hand superfamily)